VPEEVLCERLEARNAMHPEGTFFIPKAKLKEWIQIFEPLGKSIVVSATPERLSIAKTQMQGKDRDTVFSLPFIRGLY
jgi:hypothetical protein